MAWLTTCCGGHTHVHCRIQQCRVAPRVKVYKGLADPGSIHMCAQNRWVQGCTQRSKVTKVCPTNCCSEHTQTCVCCRIRQFKVAPAGQGLHGFGRPRTAVRTHTVRAHVSCRIHQSRVARTDQELRRFDDQVLLRAYTCVLQKPGLHPGVEI